MKVKNLYTLLLTLLVSSSTTSMHASAPATASASASVISFQPYDITLLAHNKIAKEEKLRQDRTELEKRKAEFLGARKTYAHAILRRFSHPVPKLSAELLKKYTQMEIDARIDAEVNSLAASSHELTSPNDYQAGKQEIKQKVEQVLDSDLRNYTTWVRWRHTRYREARIQDYDRDNSYGRNCRVCESEACKQRAQHMTLACVAFSLREDDCLYACVAKAIEAHKYKDLQQYVEHDGTCSIQ